MKINNLKINGFGKLENKEIKFNNHLNLIYGKNESGKTTLLKFISGVFYGVSKNKNKKEFPDFERYKPWHIEDFSGKMEYTLDNNQKYEVFRDFSKKNPKIYMDSQDVSKNYNIDKNKGSEFFLEQTGIDETIFTSTALVEQKNVVLDNSDQSILTQKIANILSTGEENVSYKKTIDKLNKKQLEEIGSDRTIGRPINLINEKMGKIVNAKNNIETNEDIIKQLEEKQLNIKNKVNEKKIKINLINEVKKIIEEKNLEEEKIKINNNLKEEEKIKINELKNKLEKNNYEKQNKKIIYLISSIIIIIINIILFNLKINKIVNILLIIFSLIFFGFIFLKILKNKKQKKLQKNEEKKYLLEIESKKNNIKKIEENANKINEEKNKKILKKNTAIKNAYKYKIDENEIEYLLNENKTNINNILEDLNNEVSNLQLQLYTNEIDYKNSLNTIEQKAKLEEELQNCIEEKDELQKLEKSINIAKQALINAYNRMKSEITPKFTKNLSNIVEEITKGKYNKIKFIEGEGLIVELENGEYVNANRLSIGTMEQLYLSLRISAIQEITKEKIPIILDEAFAYYDDTRLENILKYINEEFRDNQIIIFSCSNREKEILEKNNIEFNYINI